TRDAWTRRAAAERRSVLRGGRSQRRAWILYRERWRQHALSCARPSTVLRHHVGFAEAPHRRHDGGSHSDIRIDQHDRGRAGPVTLTALEPQAREIIRRYDEPRAAMLPLLWLVQTNVGHIPLEAECWVGGLLSVAVSHVREVVSFYSM